VNGTGVPIPGAKLTIIGGDDFVISAETDDNGEFTFEGADVGSYTVVYDNGTNLSSMDFKVSTFDPNMKSLGPNTGVNNGLKLVVDQNGALRFAATHGSLLMPAPISPMTPLASAVPIAPATPVGGGGLGGGGLGGGGLGGGGFGALAGALGVAGLVTGVTAMASNDDSKPVSVGAPANY
jgi:hypothetical protein